MYYNYIFSIIIFILINRITSQCICSEERAQVRCININLDAMNVRTQNQGSERLSVINIDKRILPVNALQLPNTERLKLLCDIQALNTNSFGNQNNMQELDLSQNSISTIPNDMFEPMPLLQKLNLSTNTLQSPTLDTFYALTNLKVLDASHNDIVNLELGVLDEMVKLEELYLNNNHIPDIKLGVFDELKRLTILDLSYNNMHQIDDSLLDQNKDLTKVNFAGNYFMDIKLGTFDNLKNVVIFKLANCKIQKLRLGIFDDTVKVVKLDLSTNNIEELPLGIFEQMKYLVLLNLSSNKLLGIIEGMFDENTKLANLDLSNNKLTTLPEKIFRQNELLSIVNISNNAITQLPLQTFQYTNLIVIDLSYNKLETIQPDLLNLETLETVYAQNNHISYLDDTTFETSNFPLKHLDLRNNRLVFIGEYFFDWVANLENMEIFGNPWDCKCLEDLMYTLKKKFITYDDNNYYQGILPVCVDGLSVCRKDLKNLSSYYDVYKKHID